MTRKQEGDRQDPAEPKQTDTGTETNDNPDDAAPQPAEPAPVEVAPADQSEVLRTETIHGNDYNVTADRGYRRS